MSDQTRVPLPQRNGVAPNAFVRPQQGAQNSVLHQKAAPPTRSSTLSSPHPQNQSRPAQQLEATRQRRRRFEENRFFIVNGMTTRFSPDLAREIGDRESQLLLQYEYWIATEGLQLSDGRRCLQDSLRALHGFFSWWTFSTVRRTFDSVVSQGYLYTESVPDERCQSGTNKNAGRLVFIHYGHCARLQSIQVSSRNFLLDPPKNEPGSEPGSDMENHMKNHAGNEPELLANAPCLGVENGVPTMNNKVCHNGTPCAEVFQNGAEVCQNQALVCHSGTPLIYKERARERVREYKESSSEERAGAPGGAHEATPLPASSPPIPTSDERTDDRRRNFSNFENGGNGKNGETDGLQVDDWGNLTCDDDVLGLLYAFGISAQNIRHIETKDWDEIPDAICFMRRESLSIEEIEEYVSRSRKRYHAAYLSQFVKRFYQTMPHLASRKNATRRASQQGSQVPKSAPPPASPSPALPAPKASSGEAPSHQTSSHQTSSHQQPSETRSYETESDRQRRVLYAAQSVFQALSNADAANLRDRAESQLPPLFGDRLRLARANHKEPGYSELRAIQEMIFRVLWQEQTSLCEAALGAQPEDIEAVPLVPVSFGGLRYPALPAAPEEPSNAPGHAADNTPRESEISQTRPSPATPSNSATALENTAPPARSPMANGFASGFAGATDVIGGVLRQMQNGGVSEERQFRAA